MEKNERLYFSGNFDTAGQIMVKIFDLELIEKDLKEVEKSTEWKMSDLEKLEKLLENQHLLIDEVKQLKRENERLTKVVIDLDPDQNNWFDPTNTYHPV